MSMLDQTKFVGGRVRHRRDRGVTDRVLLGAGARFEKPEQNLSCFILRNPQALRGNQGIALVDQVR